ncbi:MAG: hypothetical protein V3U60_11215 [Gammaproteobacteria bacterium]
MTTTIKESSQHESQTEFCEMRPYSAISEHSSVKGTPTHIRDWLTSLLPDSPANRSVSLANEKGPMTNETCGLKPSMSFAWYDHDSHCWRTYQDSLLTPTPDEFTETWPKAGMTVDGVAYPLPKQELRIAAIDGGVLPTPAATEYGSNQSLSDGAAVRPSLPSMARNNLWPTPTATDHRGSGQTGVLRDRLDYAAERGATKSKTYPSPDVGMAKGCGEKSAEARSRLGGTLNPTWVEWLMGWPLGWTDLKPLEMDRFQQWCEQHGIF